MSTPPLPDIPSQSAAAAAVADARIPPGDDYEEIREQVSLLCLEGISRRDDVLCVLGDSAT